ncbi:Major facilitator superfamily, partial [Globisporangium splendens]
MAPLSGRSALLRWAVLALSCVLMVGNYYCYDNAAALKSQLQQHFGDYSRDEFEMRFNLLYSLYSIPNTILPFFGGAFVDRFGINTALLLFSSFILLGQIIFASGSSFSSFNLMLAGRFVVGLGGECLSVAQGALVVEWFKNEELAFAMGLNLSISRLGSVINNELSPMVAEVANVSTALWVGVLMCLVSSVSALIIVWIEIRVQHAESLQSKTEFEGAQDDDFVPESIKLSDVKDFRASFWMLVVSSIVLYGCIIPFNSIASSLLMERDYFKQPPSLCIRCGEGAVAPYAWPLPKLSSNCTITDPQDQFKCSTSSPYIAESKVNCDSDAWRNGPLTKVYCEKKTQAAEHAATPMSIPYLISATASPFLGFAVDRIGLRALLNLAAAAVLILAHTLLGFTSVTPFIPLTLQGLAYTVFASVLWPSVPLVVEEHHIGTGYGVVTAAMNIGLAFFPLVVASLYEHASKYIPNVEVCFIALAVAGFLNGVALNAFDWKHHWVLNRSASPNEACGEERSFLLASMSSSATVAATGIEMYGNFGYADVGACYLYSTSEHAWTRKPAAAETKKLAPRIVHCRGSRKRRRDGITWSHAIGKDCRELPIASKPFAEVFRLHVVALKKDEKGRFKSAFILPAPVQAILPSLQKVYGIEIVPCGGGFSSRNSTAPRYNGHFIAFMGKDGNLDHLIIAFGLIPIPDTENVAWFFRSLLNHGFIVKDTAAFLPYQQQGALAALRREFPRVKPMYCVGSFVQTTEQRVLGISQLDLQFVRNQITQASVADTFEAFQAHMNGIAHNFPAADAFSGMAAAPRGGGMSKRNKRRSLEAADSGVADAK